MRRYELSRAADADLTAIYSYSFREFGELTADAYLASLESCLEMLAAEPELGLDIGAMRPGYRRFVHRRHAIFYRSSARSILVVRVLGPGMDPHIHLPQPPGDT